MADNYELLANAVIEQAADDYTKALCKMHEWAVEVKKLESYFTGKDIAYLTKLDCKQLMVMLQQEAKKYNYNYRAIKKSRGKD